MQRTLDTAWNFGTLHEPSNAGILTKPGKGQRLKRYHKEAQHKRKYLETRKEMYRGLSD